MLVLKKWIRAAVGFVMLAVVCLVVLILLLVSGADDDTYSRRFTSPSGAVQVRIEEGCFGFACSQSAYLVRPVWDKHLEDLDVGDPEAIVFDRATVTWNEDETQMTWRVGTRHGTKTGVVDLQ